jgi:hypothetical protein
MEKKNYAYNNHVKIQVIGTIQELTDPKTKNKIHAYSSQAGKLRVANGLVVVNHVGLEQGDFWKLEAFEYANNDKNYKYLLEYCSKGKMVFIEGTPILKKDDQNRVYPTIRIEKIIGLSKAETQNQESNKDTSSEQEYVNPFLS